MIRSNLFSRKELVELIKKSPQTKDGYYFFPRFKNLVMQQGKEKDTGFFYDRCLFKDKMCFHEDDLKVFLSKKKVKYDMQLEHFIDSKLQEALKGIEFLSLKDKLLDKDYTLEELIDTTIYITKYKYA